MKKIAAGTACAVAALTLGIMPALANDELLKLEKDPKVWSQQAGNYSNWRYSALDQINAKNVKDLQPAWTFSTGVLRGHEGGPLVIGDIMYVHTPFPNTVYALDLNQEGRILWKYQPQEDPSVIPVMCCDTVNRGVAYGDGKIILDQADTTVVALDAKTGKVVWSVKNGDPSKGETMTSAPTIYKDKVYVGISGGEFGVRGHLTAYNLKDGSRAWRGYSMGPDADTLMDPEKTTLLGKPVGKDSGTATWEGDQWKIGGGATWGWYAIDPEQNVIIYGSGNPSTWNPSQRPGDNRWSMTIFARDVDTGKAKWVFQMTPHDEWDYDGVNEMILYNAKIDGKDRKLLFHVDRNGYAYVLDRTTGVPVRVDKTFDFVNWAKSIKKENDWRPVVDAKYSPGQNGEDTNTKGICPSALGIKDQQPASYSPKSGLFYVPFNNVCMDYEPYKVSYTPGQAYVGATVSMFPPPGQDNLGAFAAWDSATGKRVWTIKEPFSVWSGALSTAGDIVFYGTLEGYLKAVDAKTGKELYRFKTPSGIIGNVTTYEHKGKQYVAVYSGIGGWAGIGLAAGLEGGTEGLGAVGAYRSLASYTQLGGQLTVFTLPNK